MTITRREFIGTTAAAMAATRFGSVWAADDPAAARFGEFPLAALIRTFQDETAPRAAAVTPTGLNRAEYLRLIRGIVRFFAAHQDAHGSIIDPYEKKERQYSTPAFALGVAALCAAGQDKDLLAAGVKAMDAACADLASGKAADGHADFFTVLLMHADRLFRPVVLASVARGWREDLARIKPETIYRRQPTAADVNNWNLVAASGEWLRTRDKLGASQAWVDRSIDRQFDHFTAHGMYRDPNDPMAYDHFARLWVLDMLDEGYTGPQAAMLESLVERGAWASLFMQSPHGELPCGGRSSHHQWNEAQQAVTFESFAKRFAKRGNRVAAAACKRAARLSMRSIGRWVRPSGELWVVKNRMDPALRHGYESYSFHSQYNLLTAAMLAMAWMKADDAIGEGPCPAEVGGFAFEVAPAFRKVFINAAGTYVEIDTGADLHYNPTGILRVHHKDMPPETISDGVTTQCGYTVPSKPKQNLAFGPAWQTLGGTWVSLAEHGREELAPARVTVSTNRLGHLEAVILYTGKLRGGARAVEENVSVAPGQIMVESRVDGEVAGVRQVRPWLAFDGLTRSQARLAGENRSHSTTIRENGPVYLTPSSDVADHYVVVDQATEAASRSGFVQASAIEAKRGVHAIRGGLSILASGALDADARMD